MKLNINLNELSLEELKTVIKLAEKQKTENLLSRYDDKEKEARLQMRDEKRKAGRPLGVRNKKKKINKHWSTYELNRLRSMNTAGYSEKRIAKELNRTVPSVASMIWKIKVNYDRHNLKTLKPLTKNPIRKLKKWTEK
jgi:hypothetical protein